MVSHTASGIYISGGDSLVIPQSTQDKLPFNEDIFVVVTADWRGLQQLSIAYKIRFNTKLVLEVSPSKQIVPLGHQVDFQTKSSYLINTGKSGE